MKIMAYQETSMLDFPGQITSIVFCQGCNRHCNYCHNPESIPQDVEGTISWSSILQHLKNRIGLLDAVTFSGGEPTLQPDLLEKILICQGLGYKIGLHTNGEGSEFSRVVQFCDYILLSHPTPEKIKLANEAASFQLSEVIKNEFDKWENIIT